MMLSRLARERRRRWMNCCKCVFCFLTEIRTRTCKLWWEAWHCLQRNQQSKRCELKKLFDTRATGKLQKPFTMTLVIFIWEMHHQNFIVYHSIHSITFNLNRLYNFCPNCSQACWDLVAAMECVLMRPSLWRWPVSLKPSCRTGRNVPSLDGVSRSNVRPLLAFTSKSDIFSFNSKQSSEIRNAFF